MFHVVFRILLLVIFVGCSGSVASVGEEWDSFLLLFTCNYVVFVGRGFLLLVLGIGYAILFWHSLSLQFIFAYLYGVVLRQHVYAIYCKFTAVKIENCHIEKFLFF